MDDPYASAEKYGFSPVIYRNRHAYVLAIPPCYKLVCFSGRIAMEFILKGEHGRILRRGLVIPGPDIDPIEQALESARLYLRGTSENASDGLASLEDILSGTGMT